MQIKPPVLETVQIEKLKPWPGNPRVHHAVETIANSIKKLGYLVPIIVQSKTYRVLSGHGRLKALKRKKVKSVPVIVANITDKNADLFTLADNQIHDLSKFDMGKMPKLLNGFGKLDLKLMGFGKFNAKPKTVEPEEDKPKKVTFYANSKNSTKLIVVFESKNQLQFVKKRIEELQGNSDKSMGDVVYAQFKKVKI